MSAPDAEMSQAFNRINTALHQWQRYTRLPGRVALFIEDYESMPLFERERLAERFGVSVVRGPGRGEYELAVSSRRATAARGK